MHKQKKTLGISFNESEFSFTEIDYSGETPLVLNIGNGKFPSKLLLEDLEKSGKINLFANTIANVLRHKNIIEPKHVAIGLDSSFALVHKFQIDADLREEDFSKHLKWELEKVSGENAENFKFDFHKFHYSNSNNLQTIIIFAVNKKITDFLEKIAKIVKLNVVSLDLDITSVFKLLENSYSDTKLNKPNLLVKFSDFIKIILFQFDTFWEFTLAANEPNSIAEAINYLFTKYSTSQGKLTSVSNIFYYSDKKYLDHNLIKHLEIISSNPPLQITPNLIFQNEEGSVMAAKFIEPISLALKND